ncbi:MAG: MBL fold metallo-hydrolase [Syntrophomonadales bacterium]|jgi:glyoxylase-like metal-dependent hydrolase (beta-lactamase superfamily II)
MTVKICPQVYQVGGDGLSHPHDCCVYLVEAENDLALIDTGAGKGTGRILKNIESCGFSPDNVRYILVTHGHIDHIGGLKELKEKTGAAVVAHKLELDAIENGNPRLTAAAWYGVKYKPVKVDRVIKEDNETLTMGNTEFVFLHTPGHTPGSLSILCQGGGLNVLFGQDIHGPFNREWGSDMKEWRSSMQRLLTLNADILCEGHFGTYEPASSVRQYIESYLRQYKR